MLFLSLATYILSVEAFYFEAYRSKRLFPFPVRPEFTSSRKSRCADNIATTLGSELFVVASDNDAIIPTEVIDGKAIAKEIRDEIRVRVEKLQTLSGGSTPGLAVILVGSRRDSQTYVNMKRKACLAAGITTKTKTFEDTVTQEEILATIQQLNADKSIHGILVQLPLPSHLDQELILQTVGPEKDVDGLHPKNIAALQLFSGEATKAPFSIPCTPLGCLELLDRSGVELKGKHCAVLGRSNLVGLPMARLLLGRDASVTILHSKSNNIPEMVRQSDVVVAAVGRASLVKGDWLKPGAVVIDVGINSVDIIPKKTGGKSYKLVGDVDYEAAATVCSKITPVPGGVGPMTIAMLLRNTVASFERATGAGPSNLEI